MEASMYRVAKSVGSQDLDLDPGKKLKMGEYILGNLGKLRGKNEAKKKNEEDVYF